VALPDRGFILPKIHRKNLRHVIYTRFVKFPNENVLFNPFSGLVYRLLAYTQKMCGGPRPAEMGGRKIED
jgi:hypothetical protein